MKHPHPKYKASAIVTAALSGLLLLSAHPAKAANDTWTGGGAPDGRWQNGNNWGGIAPVAKDTLTFFGSVQTLATNDFPGDTIFNGITFDGGADPFTLSGNRIALVTFTNGYDLTPTAPVGGCITNSSFNAETISLPIVLSPGKHSIITAGGGLLNLNGPVTRSRGAVVVFTPGSGNITVTGGLETNGWNNILGGWATIGNDWATLDATSNVVAYVAYTTIAAGAIANAPASNVKYVGDTGVLTAANGTAINSLLAEQGVARSLTIATGGTMKLGANGGIYRDSGAVGVFTVTGGFLTANGGGEISLSDGPFTATGNNLVVNSLLTNDGPNVVSVNILGYVQINGGANTYSGGTYINQGRVQITPAVGFGTGPVYVYPGGQILFNANSTYTNSFFIGGVGSSESGGLGAFRMGGAGRTLTGIITLMGDACIANNGKVSGPITGPGSLFIGHGSSGNGHGVIQIGGAVANDYSGDTTIGSAAQAADTLQINAGFNNVMPHGAGKGNLVLNGGTAAITANFDLNGTTQTINGLTNTGVNPANNRVTSTAGATLILGDNDASATFNGNILNSVSVTKIGSGTQILNGANSYTNATTVSGGTLLFGTGSFPAATSALTINSDAALDLSAVTPLALISTGTLSMSNGSVKISLPVLGSALTTPTLVVNGTTNKINVDSIPSISTYPAVFTAIKYTNLTGTLNFGLGTLPSSPGTPFAGYVSNNVANNSVDVIITAGPTSIKWQGYAGGSPNSTWDIATTPNWVTFAGSATTFSDGSFVQFDDSASNGIVTLSQNVAPAGISITNGSLAYTINGGNKIGGGGGVTKKGSGTAILDNTGADDYTGGVTILAGTLQFGNNDSGGNLPATASVLDNAALVFNRNDLVAVPNLISGTGSLAQNGSGTLNLAGANTFSGAATVAAGATLQTANNSALGTTNGGTTVASGATLDVTANAINLGQEIITLSGNGVGGVGALINSAAAAGFVGPNAARVILAGDTAVGGGGRFDLRSATTSNPLLGSLSTGGLPRKLTKVGTGTFGLIGITVDPQLGDIEVQQGIFSTEAALTGLGNAASNLIVWPGATFQMFAVTNLINKVFTLGGDGTALTISATSGANTIIGPMNLTNDCLFSANPVAVSLTLNNLLTGPGKIVKTGAGPLTLAGNSPAYAGGLQQNAGNVTLTGTLNAPLGVTVAAGKFLLNGSLLGGGLTNSAATTVGGSGTNMGTADISGFLNPGDTNVIGTLTFNGLLLQAGASMTYDLASVNTPGGGTNDLVQVNGDLTVNGNSITINSLGLLKTGIANPYRLFNYTGALIWNGDLAISGNNNYTFTFDTNTVGQVNIVASGGPPVWNGASATTDNWSDAANWAGVTIVSGDSLFFNGPARLSNINDTSPDTSYTDLNFVAGAGAFVLKGNPLTLGGNVVNNSSNPQTVVLGLDFSGNRTLNGATAPLIIGGGVTNLANTTLTLAGTGTLTNLMGATDPTTMTNILSVSSNANWTLVDNAAATPITTPVQLDILQGTFNFGSGASAPTLISIADASISRLGVLPGAPATLNMINGTLTIAARLNTGTAANVVAALNQSGGTINLLSLLQVSDSSANAYTTVNVSGGTLNVGTPVTGQNLFLASRGTGVVTVASSGVINCATLDMSRNAAGNTLGSVGVVNLNGGLLAVTRVGAATSASQAGGTPTATFNFNGGTLMARASSGTFYQGNAASPAIPITSIVKSGGAVIDTTNFNISILEPLQHDSSLGATKDGGLTKYGSGTLTLTVASTYTGVTVVTNGTLLVNGSLGQTAVTVATNATLGGTGTAGTNVTVSAGGTLSPGTSIGTLTVAGNVTLQADSTNFMELNKSLATSDLLRATTTTATTITYGGTLSLTNLAGTLTGSDTFKLFSATNYAGSFSAIIPAIPAPGLAWNTSTLAVDGTLRFTVTVNTTPTNIVAVLTGNQLNLSWPADHTGWRLQVQTNSITTGLSSNWVDVPGSTAVNSVTFTVDPANGAVFFRMIYP